MSLINGIGGIFKSIGAGIKTVAEKIKGDDSNVKPKRNENVEDNQMELEIDDSTKDVDLSDFKSVKESLDKSMKDGFKNDFVQKTKELNNKKEGFLETIRDFKSGKKSFWETVKSIAKSFWQ